MSSFLWRAWLVLGLVVGVATAACSSDPAAAAGSGGLGAAGDPGAAEGGASDLPGGGEPSGGVAGAGTAVGVAGETGGVSVGRGGGGGGGDGDGDGDVAGAGAGDAGAGAGAGGGGGSSSSELETILEQLRADRDGTLLLYSRSAGWPVPVEGGYLFVSADLSLSTLVANQDVGQGAAMTLEDDFAWIVVDMPAQSQYRFEGELTSLGDPWSRSYAYDGDAEVGLLLPAAAHLDRYFQVTEGTLQPRTVRVWVPTAAPSHVLYAHDGQNLFDPGAIFGGWKLQAVAPPAMMIVGIDSTADRFDELSHVPDDPGTGLVGGNIEAYAELIDLAVRPLIEERYGAAPKVGVMGSSLGGLASFYLAQAYPADYDFAASLSGTIGWGSLGSDVQNTTLLDLYDQQGHGAVYLYLDSGGPGGACVDADGDGVEDDALIGDNYCETAQLYGLLKSLGYVDGSDVTYYWEPNASHDESAWAARVHRPLDLFASL